MKLIPLSDFVLGQEKAHFYGQTEWSTICERIINYTKFLKQPLTLGMFVPYDEGGNVLEEPKNDDLNSSFFQKQQYFNDLNKYDEAKENVIFKGILKINKEPYKSTKRHLIDLVSGEKFMRIYTELTYWTGEIDREYFDGKNLKVEDLIKYDLTLTPSALEAIGIKEK
jgi:hypothetical protein